MASSRRGASPRRASGSSPRASNDIAIRFFTADNLAPAGITADAPDTTFQTAAWLITEAGLTPSQMQTLEKYLTVNAQVFRLQAVGHFDGGGLYLNTAPSGHKTWRLQYRIGGKKKVVCVGGGLGVAPGAYDVLAETRARLAEAAPQSVDDVRAAGGERHLDVQGAHHRVD